MQKVGRQESKQLHVGAVFPLMLLGSMKTLTDHEGGAQHQPGVSPKCKQPIIAATQPQCRWLEMPLQSEPSRECRKVQAKEWPLLGSHPSLLSGKSTSANHRERETVQWHATHACMVEICHSISSLYRNYCDMEQGSKSKKPLGILTPKAWVHLRYVQKHTHPNTGTTFFFTTTKEER